MFMRKQLLGAAAASASIVLSAPLAFADGPKKTTSVYDDDEEDSIAVAPGPGLSSAAKEPAAPTELAKLEKDLTLKTETIEGVRVTTSTFLERNIEKARKALAKNVDKADAKLDESFKKYLQVEGSVSSTLSELKSPKEDLLPASIYILVGTLSGSILARRRGILLRATAPIVFGVASFSYFLPETFKNHCAFVWKYEQKVPAVASAHLKTLEALEEVKKGSESAAKASEDGLVSAVHSVRKTIVDWTGLQLPSDSSSSSSSKKNN